MASNPMQRKARNSFLIGMIISLVVAIIIGVLLYVFLIKDKLIVSSGESESSVYVYKLKKGVVLKSGDEITPNMVDEIKIRPDVIPKDAKLARRKNENGSLEIIPFLNNQKAKIALTEGTILSESMLYVGDKLEDSERLIEFNMITLPSTLYVGEYVDIRLITPTGEDYIVLSQKPVKSIKEATIGLLLTEDEIMTMSSAIIDAYTMNGSNLYAIKYVEPGNQGKAAQTYVVKESVLKQMTINPNILKEARDKLASRWNNENGSVIRTNLEETISLYGDAGLSNVEEKMKRQIEKSKEQYLAGLEGY